MKLTDALSAVQVKRATLPPGKVWMKLSDGKGMYLLINQTGKYWRFDYRFAGKRKTLALGVYPDVSLKRAREKRDEARSLIADGIDPAEVRREERRARLTTFEAIAREWLSKQSFTPKHARTTQTRIERYLLPKLGSRPIAEITAQELITAIEPIEKTGLETLRRVRRIAAKIFQYAIVKGAATYNPAAGIGDVFKTPQNRNFATLTDPKKIGELLRAIEGYSGTFPVRCALQIAPFVFVRPGELRHAEWSEIDLDAATWRIPAERMKMRRPHTVPLARQVVAILRELEPLTGGGRYLFPSVRSTDRPMSENTVNAALRRLGFEKSEICGHGFRAMASTLLHEQGWPSDVIERQLAHVERNAVKAAYNHATHLPERVKMMQAWADYLDALRDGAVVVPIRGRRQEIGPMITL